MKQISCLCIALLLLFNCLCLAGCSVQSEVPSSTTVVPQTSTPPATGTQAQPVGTQEDLQALIDAWNAVIVQGTVPTDHIEWYCSSQVYPTQIPVSDDQSYYVGAAVSYFASLPIDPERFELCDPTSDKLPANMGMKLTFWSNQQQTYDEEGYENGELVLPLTIRVSMDNTLYIELKSNPTIMACYKFAYVDYEIVYRIVYNMTTSPNSDT